MADDIDLILREAERLSRTARDLARSRAGATGRDDYEQMQALRASPYASRIPSATPTVQELREAQELVAGPQTLGTGMAAGGAARGALDFAARLGNEPFRLLEQGANVANVRRAREEGFGANLEAARAVRERDPFSNAPREFFEEIKFPFPGAAGVAADVANPLDPFGPIGDVVSTIGLGVPFLRLAKRYLPDAADTIERGAARASANAVEPKQNAINMFEELSNNYIGDEGVQFEFLPYGKVDDWNFDLTAQDVDSGVTMSVYSGFDVNGNPVLYIDSLSSDAAMEGRPNSMRASAVVNAVLEVADASGIPVHTEPRAFVPRANINFSRMSPNEVDNYFAQNPPMSTTELKEMYNRLGFEPPTSSTPRFNDNGDLRTTFVRNPVPLEPEARQAEYARRLQPEVLETTRADKMSLLDQWAAEDYIPELSELTSEEIEALLDYADQGQPGQNASYFLALLKGNF